MNKYIEMYLEDFDMTKKELSIKMDITTKKMSEILSGKARITADDAFALSRAFGTTVDLWVNLQNNNRIKKNNKEAEENIENAGYKILVNEKVFKNAEGVVNRNNQLVDFFGISRIENITRLYQSKLAHAYRTESINTETIVWLRKAELVANKIEPGQFVKADFNFNETVDSIFDIWKKEQPFQEKINSVKNELFSRNIVLVGAPYIKKSTISAFTSYASSSKKISIYLSDKFNRSSNILFSLIHELFHIKDHLVAKGFTKYSDEEEKGIDDKVGSLILNKFKNSETKPGFYKSCYLWNKKQETRKKEDNNKYINFKKNEKHISFKGGING